MLFILVMYVTKINLGLEALLRKYSEVINTEYVSWKCLEHLGHKAKVNETMIGKENNNVF